MHRKNIEPKVAGSFPATVYYTEDETCFYVKIIPSSSLKYDLSNVRIKYVTETGKSNYTNISGQSIKQPKNLFCSYEVEFKNFWGYKFFLKFNLGIPPVTNLRYSINENGKADKK